MLDVRRLRMLREVALHGTIRAAAESLSFTPSAVSQQLSALEREVGCELLERRGRSVHLTAAGRVLVERAEPILAQLADAAAAAGPDVELAGLADEPWINSTNASSCHPFLLRACAAAGFEPRIAAETVDHRALHHLVASGVGLAVIPVLSQLDLPPSLVAKPI